MAKSPPFEPRSKHRTGTASTPPEQLELDFVRFKRGGAPVDFAVDFAADAIWATRAQIAEIFGVGAAAVADRIAALFATGELSAETNRRAARTTHTENGREVSRADELYDLDVILAVGYRIDAAKASTFRRWANQMLRAFIVDGFALNEARLREDRRLQNHLAARLRRIRAEETNIYESVRAFFKAAANDYEERSDAVAAFTAMLQAKFIFAATGETASDLILERADHDAPGMGLRTYGGQQPTITEAKIAANYLDADELHILHTLCEQFLLYIEGKAVRQEAMTMRELSAKLDDLLRLDDYPVLSGHKDMHKDRAIRHAQAEYARFIMRAGSDVVSLDP